MPTRQEMISALRSQDSATNAPIMGMKPSRNEMIEALRSRDVQQPAKKIDFKPMTFEELTQPGYKPQPKIDEALKGVVSEYGESIIRPALQGLGAAGGGIIGGTAGALGGGVGAAPLAVAGGGLGYAGGEQLYKILTDLVGITKPGTVGQETEQAIKNVAEGMTMEMAGMGAGAALAKAAKPIMPLLKKGGKSLYNVAEDAVERIVTRPKQVAAAAKNSPYEGGLQLIDEMNQAINSRVSNANTGLEEVLGRAEQAGKTVDIKPIIDSLENSANNITAITKTSRTQKQELLDTVTDLERFVSSRGSYDLSPSEANIIKRQLQDEAYPKNALGQNVYRKDVVGKSLKDASRVAKLQVEKRIPGVKQYNKQLQEILEFQTNKKFMNAFSPDNIERTMTGIQSPTGNKGKMQELIRNVDKVLGSNIEDTTLDYFAAKYMKGGDVLSGYVTGRSSVPAALGFYLGGVPGAVAGATIGSPATFRAVTPRMQPVIKGVEALGRMPAAQAVGRSLPYAVGRESE